MHKLFANLCLYCSFCPEIKHKAGHRAEPRFRGGEIGFTPCGGGSDKVEHVTPRAGTQRSMNNQESLLP